MTTPLLWANLCGAVLAVLVNAWGVHAGPPEHRILRATVATLAATYATLYALTIAGAIDGDTRTAIAQGLGPVAWLTVWAAPAVRTTQVYRRSLAALTAMLNRVPAPKEPTRA